jgi:type IV secretion system protein TrbG
MKKFATFIAFAFFALSATAQTKRFLTLEDAAIAQAKKWQQTGVAKPIVSDDGRVLYPYGQYMPQLTCTLLRACDIQLEPGELITSNPKAGDAVRFIITKAKHGSGDKEVTHLVVKPTDVGIETNLIIYTDRRVYQVKLASAANERDYVHAIGFYYPEDMADEWAETEKLQDRARKLQEKTAAAQLPAACADKLDFAYRIEGKANFKPLRVFNTCGKVYIHLPEVVAQSVAPVLVSIGKDGNAEYLNYRAKTATILEVDKLFNKAVLVSDSDSDEQRITITWTKNEKKSWFSWNSEAE